MTKQLKPLAWHPEYTDASGYSSTHCRTVFVLYDVWRLRSASKWKCYGRRGGAGAKPRTFETRELAMQAAADDYAARVAELFEDVPQEGSTND